ncbi:ribonuclease P protein component [Candidatus Wolfebacteria bacterium]|nr:ribonuclease P protein component [Candidatus Wolfebacteria bacterium]
MLTKNQRLSRDEFTAVFESGTRIHGDAFTLVLSPTTALPKASTVVSKKIAGGVIARNLLKRRLYNVLKTNLSQDSILIAKKAIKDKKFSELLEEYKKLLEKSK